MKIRNITLRGESWFQVDLGVRHTGGKRQRVRKTFRTRAEAEACAAAEERKVKRDGNLWDRLPLATKVELVLAHERAQLLGVSLTALLDRVQQGDSISAAEVSGVTVTEAIEALLQAKVSAGNREKYTNTLRQQLGQFASQGRGGLAISSITPDIIDGWIRSKTSSPGGIVTYRKRLSALFSFAVRRGWVSENPISRLETVRQDAAEPTIWSPRRIARALVWVRRNAPQYLAWFVLASFEGVRPEELDKLSWSDIDLEAARLKVSAQASKVRRARIIDLCPASVAWLRIARDLGSKLPVNNDARKSTQIRLRDYLRLDAWPKDVLRHSAASYWVAETQDAAKVALRLGNSVGILLKHYRAAVTKESARRFFSLVPRTARGQIVQLAKVA